MKTRGEALYGDELKTWTQVGLLKLIRGGLGLVGCWITGITTCPSGLYDIAAAQVTLPYLYAVYLPTDYTLGLFCRHAHGYTGWLPV